MAEILIVDDEQQIRSLLSAYLTAAGYRCRTADGVTEAKKQLAGHAFALILSDVNMADGSGIDLIHHARRLCAHTPIVMVSVIDNPVDARQALELGVYGYIVKPFTRNIVLINVENALKRKQLESERIAHLEALEALVEQRTRTLNDRISFQRHLMDAIPNPIFFKDIHGRFQGCNTAFERLVDARHEDILGKRAEDLLPQLDLDSVRRTDRQLLERPGKLTYEMTITDTRDEPRHFMFNKATYRDASGKTAGFVGVLVDITDRNKAEEALRISEEKLRQITEHIGIGVTMIAPDRSVLWVNRQMRQWFPEIRIGQQMPCHLCDSRPRRENQFAECPAVAAMKTGEAVETIQSIQVRQGRLHFRRLCNPVLDKDGQVVAVVNLVEEITRKIAREHELRQTQKLQAIGQLAAGIAHEINTPIQYIGDNTRFVQEATTDLIDLISAFTRLLAAIKDGACADDLVRDAEARIETADLAYLQTEIPLAVEQTLEGVSRVSGIVSAMRHFSHPGSDHKSPVDINRALSATITVARNAWKYVADLETDFDPDLPKVFCLPGEINQAFLNVLINAAHAVGEARENGSTHQGRITIATRKHRDRVEIRFSDNGTGIPDAIRDRIFDPFFTTKAVGQGTGQGLAITHSVITDRHAGTIRLESHEGHGTTFVIELPVNGSVNTVGDDET